MRFATKQIAVKIANNSIIVLGCMIVKHVLIVNTVLTVNTVSTVDIVIIYNTASTELYIKIKQNL